MNILKCAGANFNIFHRGISILITYLKSDEPLNLWIVKFLVDNGCEFNMKNTSALVVAAKNPYCPLEILEFLIELGIDTNYV